MITPTVIGNWKMNGSRFDTLELLSNLTSLSPHWSDAQVVVCPPLPYLSLVQALLKGSAIKVGAQNLSHHSVGAFTGETAAVMLREFDCQYVLVGHSERRHFYQESDDIIAAKFETALNADLVPVLCVGETLAERQQQKSLEVVSRQVDAIINPLGVGVFSHAIIAYEPVWAIGTGLNATPDQAQEVHARIRQQLHSRNPNIAAKTPILYGGSVKANNAEALFSQPDINGGLIGGASLNASEFSTICKHASQTLKSNMLLEVS